MVGFALHRFGPVREVNALVVQDDELGAVGAAGQRGAQVADDEVPLLRGGEGNGGEPGGCEERREGLVLRRHCPEGHVVFGVFIQEPGTGTGGQRQPRLPTLCPLPRPPGPLQSSSIPRLQDGT